MSVTIEQAIYGDKNDAHALLNTSLEDIKLANKICNSTDLADRGTNWTPAIRGFNFEDLYLLMKTYPDASATRQGRVFSHVLIIKKNDLSDIDDLSALFKYFPLKIDKSVELIPITYKDEKTVTGVSTNRIMKVVRGLLREETVVWIGQEDFPEAIAQIWRNLWGSVRFDFSFGINFNPSSVQGSIHHMVCTPEQMRSKWSNEKFCIIEKEEGAIVATSAETYLARLTKDSTFSTLFEELGARPTTLKQLSVLENGLETFQSLTKVRDFNELYNFYNIIKSYQPSTPSAKELLNKILSRIIEILPSLGCQSLNALRKVDLKDHSPELVIQINKTIADWLVKFLFSENAKEIDSQVKIVLNSSAKESQNWWAVNVDAALEVTFKTWETKFTKSLLRWLTSDFKSIYAITEKYFNYAPNLELDITDVLPDDLLPEVSKGLLTVSISRDWFVLHAKILFLTKVTNILSAQIKVDTDVNNISGVKLISELIDPQKFISQSLLLEDERLFKLSGKLVVNDKRLLKNFDVTSVNWQKIIASILDEGNSLDGLFKNPEEEVVYPILEQILNHEDIDQNLLQLIAGSGFADLTLYKRRSEIWGVLPSLLVERFVQVTANGVVKQALFFESSIEEPLENWIVGDKFVSTYVTLNYSDVGKVINFFGKFSSIGERHLNEYLNKAPTNFNGIVAKRLGTLVKQRNWSSTANLICGKASSSKSFKTALQECSSLLGFFGYGTAVFNGLITSIDISLDDWWQEFTSLAAHLFPEGPIDNNIWKRAGGAQSVLQHKATGENMWREALYKLRNGGCKKITITNLLSEMKHDFPNNKDLEILREIKKKI